MKHDIYAYKSYKTLINDLLDIEGRGARRKLALFCKCQESYLSTVLNGENDLNLEQVDRVSDYFEMSVEESEFLILLNQENRAGSKSLRQKLSKMIEESKSRNTRLNKKLAITDQISLEDQTVYYSHWSYSAIHLLMMIPGFDTVEMISKRLHLNTGDVKSVLQFLLKIGLATKTLKGYEASNKFLHLDKGSPIIGQLHANWRLKAVDVVRMDQPDNLHYSGVMTMLSSDFAKLKSMFTECLKESVEVVKESKDEQLVVLGIDLFRL